MKNSHPGQSEVLSKPGDFGGHRAEVLCQEGEWSEVCLQRGEQLAARSPTPAPSTSVRGITRNLEGLNEADEVVDPHKVESIERGAYSPPPPTEAFAPVIWPAIVRVSPQLPVPGEGVGRASGEHRRSSGAIEPEELGMARHIGRVRAAEDWKIADQSNVTAAGMCPKP